MGSGGVDQSEYEPAQRANIIYDCAPIKFMQIDNPLRLNDWDAKPFLEFVLSVQSAVLVLIGLSAVGIEIPVIRPLVCFVYLTFIPGFVVLRILGLHALNVIETYVYTVALSIAVLMFTGYLQL